MTPPMAGPPPSSGGGGGTRAVLPPPTALPSSGSSDPNLLLDAFDKFTKQNAKNAKAKSMLASQNINNNKANKAKAPPDPDPIQFLNSHYTSENVLVAQLPAIREAISERMDQLDDRISSALQRQAETAEATQRHVQDAKASVQSLEQRILQVQSKAGHSEKAVREITKDMKRLDCAKRHLQRTITTLKRLHMLIHAVEQLRLACLRQPFPDYQAAAHLVDATRLLLKHFDAYLTKVEPMRLLSQKVSDLQGELKFCVVRGFRIVGFGHAQTMLMERTSKLRSLRIAEEGDDLQEPTLMSPSVMAGGCMLIDSLGQDARQEFIQGFSQDHLQEYNRTFQPVRKQPKVQPRVSSFKVQPEAPKEQGKPEFCLELMERRFVWFRNFLAGLDEIFPQVFPSYWNLQYSLTRLFLKLTRQHIMAMLGGPNKDPDANNATILLKALQKTILFEKEVATALERQYGTVFIVPATADDKGAASKSPLRGALTRATSFDTGEPLVEEEGRASTDQEPVKPFLGLASSAYDNYMGPYIALEEQNMDEQLVESLEDRTVDTRGELPVFTTSTKLFVYIKGSITRCTALTKGNAFFLLHQAFQDSLRKYAQVLSSKLPPPIPQPSNVGGLSIANVQFGKKEGTTTPAQMRLYRVPKGEEVTVCHVIGTCEYCADTVEALEDLIRDTIDDGYKAKIDMMGQQEVFHDITAKSIRVLVSGLENRLEDPLKMMTSIDWGVFYDVGEESDYVRYMHNEIQPYVTTARGLIPTSYFRSFCDKFALGFMTTYYNTLIRLKRISEPGTQQLLLDVYNLKTLFLKLPVLEKSASTAASTTTARKGSVPAGSTIAPAMYTKIVQKHFQKIETLLKLTGTPSEMLIDVFRVQWVGGSALDLQTVMSLKGMKRNEQAAMLEKFGLDPVTALKGATVNVTSATIVSERLQAVQDQASRVNSDLSQMRQKVDDFRKSFR